MATRDRIALSVPPLILRLVLGVTFLWAGLAKTLTTMPVSPEAAAALSSMDVAITNAPSPTIIPGGAMLTPRAPLGITGAGFQNGAGAGGAGNTTPPFPADGFSKPKPDDKPETKPEQPAETPTTPPAEPKKSPFPVVPPPVQVPVITPPPVSTGAVKTAADFPNPQPVRSVYMLAYTVYKAANPTPTLVSATGDPAVTPMRLLPAELGQGSRPVYMAFTIAATEIIAGAMLLIGMLSRLWALAVAGVMIGAIWLTQIGPAIANGNTMLGILPNYPWGDISKWQPMLWQVSLLGAALAVFFAGSGALAVDNALFGRRANRLDLDE